MKKLKVISLFSGAGGLDLGFKKAGYNIIGSAEIMKTAVETYNYNFKTAHNIIDLSKYYNYSNFINKYKDTKIDLLIGGFPCQGYSLAGKRDTKDERNQLYIKVVDTLKDLKINNFVLENVPGILSMNEGKEIIKIEKYFNDNGFYFKKHILDSSNFNVPQKRKRVIFIGTSNKKELPKIDEIFKELLDIKNKKISVKDSIEDLENAPENKEFNHIYTKHGEKTIEKISKVEVGKTLYDNYKDAFIRIDYNKPSPTVKENHGGVHIHPVKNRVLTPRELARLQTFPDDFIFKGSKAAQLIQIGNAVPVEFAKIIANNVKKLFN